MQLQSAPQSQKLEAIQYWYEQLDRVLIEPDLICLNEHEEITVMLTRDSVCRCLKSKKGANLLCRHTRLAGSSKKNGMDASNVIEKLRELVPISAEEKLLIDDFFKVRECADSIVGRKRRHDGACISIQEIQLVSDPKLQTWLMEMNFNEEDSWAFVLSQRSVKNWIFAQGREVKEIFIKRKALFC